MTSSTGPRPLSPLNISHLLHCLPPLALLFLFLFLFLFVFLFLPKPLDLGFTEVLEGVSRWEGDSWWEMRLVFAVAEGFATRKRASE
ncbi:hypothetical protein HYC85_025180 [Camellia sinensis]|uniref:Uncharacterized protein n=1 Tax=Camellia sinensis TaxID=4442 RepID=A0A7J7GE31_CAMSI|nr:hypothetical protein HYC85_025180 [Camellia sinensis]